MEPEFGDVAQAKGRLEPAGGGSGREGRFLR